MRKALKPLGDKGKLLSLGSSNRKDVGSMLIMQECTCEMNIEKRVVH